MGGRVGRDVEVNDATALVAEHHNWDSREREILAVARLSKQPGGREAEFAMVISDLWQNRGLGTLLLKKLIEDPIDALYTLNL